MADAVTTICAWCQKEEGRITILEAQAPMAQIIRDINDEHVSHGICQRHAAEVLDAYSKAKETA